MKSEDCEACVKAEVKENDIRRPLNPFNDAGFKNYRLGKIEYDRKRDCTCNKDQERGRG